MDTTQPSIWRGCRGPKQMQTYLAGFCQLVCHIRRDLVAGTSSGQGVSIQYGWSKYFRCLAWHYCAIVWASGKLGLKIQVLSSSLCYSAWPGVWLCRFLLKLISFLDQFVLENSFLSCQQFISEAATQGEQQMYDQKHGVNGSFVNQYRQLLAVLLSSTQEMGQCLFWWSIDDGTWHSIDYFTSSEIYMGTLFTAILTAHVNKEGHCASGHNWTGSTFSC